MAELKDFELRSTPSLLHWYETESRQMAFRARSRAEAEIWQNALREVIMRLLGITTIECCELDVHQIESVKEAGYTRDLVVIQTVPGEYMPCYILIPDEGPRPFKPVVALHGHGTLGARGI